MQYRALGRTGWQVSDVGYGMWQVGGGWGAPEDENALRALERSVELGCNFFDTAWGYGAGHSEALLGRLVRNHPDQKLYTATKIPPKNFIWPSRRGFTLDDCFPPDHIKGYTETSLQNMGLDSVDLQQFHVWEDSWANDERWQRAVDDLKRQGLIRAVGVSVNRWEPWNCLQTVRTGMIDSVQVIYNIFDQNPEDELFPLCAELNVAVIARVPFDEGTLTGTLTKDTTFAKDDWRSSYFVPENLIPSVEHAEALRSLLPPRMTMPEMALRFILSNPTVSTVIPGMRKLPHVDSNIAVSDGKGLPTDLVDRLRAHRWDREPTNWSQ